MKKIISLLIVITGFTLTNTCLGQQLEWAKTFGSFLYDLPIDILVDEQGNVYSIGTFSSTLDFDPGPNEYNLTSWGGTDIYIQKLDMYGNLLWVHRIGDDEDDKVAAIAQDEDNNLYIVGNHRKTVDFDPSNDVFLLNSQEDGWDKFFVLKLDENGNFIWAKQPQGTGQATISSLQIHDNHLYLGGDFCHLIDFDLNQGEHNVYAQYYPSYANGSDDMFILKLDTAGNFVWVRNYENPWISSLHIDKYSNDIVVVGSFGSSGYDFNPDSLEQHILPYAGYVDGYILKLNEFGDFKWVYSIASPQEDHIFDVEIDSNSNIYFAGTYNPPVDFDLLSGEHFIYSPSEWDLFISKIDKDANLIWAKGIQGYAEDKYIFVNDIEIDHEGNVYATGHFNGTYDFDPDNSVFDLTAEGYGYTRDDLYLLKLSTIGDFEWAFRYGSIEFNRGMALNIDQYKNIYLTGLFEGNIDFDPSAGTYEINSNYKQIFIAKLSQGYLTQSVHEASSNTPMYSLYPNPLKDHFTLEHHIEFSSIEAYDQIGKKIPITLNSSNHRTQVQVNAKPGIYFLQLEQDGEVFTQKIIIQ